MNILLQLTLPMSVILEILLIKTLLFQIIADNTVNYSHLISDCKRNCLDKLHTAFQKTQI